MEFDWCWDWTSIDVLPSFQINRYTDSYGDHYWDVVLAFGPGQLIVRWG